MSERAQIPQKHFYDMRRQTFTAQKSWSLSSDRRGIKDSGQHIGILFRTPERLQLTSPQEQKD